MARRGYVQLANGFYLNRKVRRLRRTMPSAISAFVIMLSYCGDNLTDGYVDDDTAEFVLDITTQELDALQQVGLIEAVDGGYVIHDYLEHNRSRQQVMAKRKREHDRYSAGSLPAESAQTAGRIETESGQTPEHQNTRMNYLKIIQLPLPPQSLTSLGCSTVLSVFTRRTGSTGRHLRLECSWKSNGPRS